MRFRKAGIDAIARVNAARDIFAVLPGIWTRSRTEDVLAPKTAWIAVQPSRPIVAISMMLRIDRDHRDDTAIGEEHMVERTIGVPQDLPALTANLLERRHNPLQIVDWQVD